MTSKLECRRGDSEYEHFWGIGAYAQKPDDTCLDCGVRRDDTSADAKVFWDERTRSDRLSAATEGVVTALEEVLPEYHKRAHKGPGHYTCKADLCITARAALKELEEASE